MRPNSLSTFVLVSALSLLLAGSVGCDREEETVAPAEPVETTPAEPAAPTIDTETKVRFETLMEQVTEHVRKREFDAADTGLRELEKMAGTLPETMRQQITTVRAALTAARTGSTPAAAPPAANPAPAPAAPAQ